MVIFILHVVLSESILTFPSAEHLQYSHYSLGISLGGLI